MTRWVSQISLPQKIVKSGFRHRGSKDLGPRTSNPLLKPTHTFVFYIIKIHTFSFVPFCCWGIPLCLISSFASAWTVSLAQHPGPGSLFAGALGQTFPWLPSNYRRFAGYKTDIANGQTVPVPMTCLAQLHRHDSPGTL